MAGVCKAGAFFIFGFLISKIIFENQKNQKITKLKNRITTGIFRNFFSKKSKKTGGGAPGEKSVLWERD